MIQHYVDRRIIKNHIFPSESIYFELDIFSIEYYRIGQNLGTVP